MDNLFIDLMEQEQLSWEWAIGAIALSCRVLYSLVWTFCVVLGKLLHPWIHPIKSMGNIGPNHWTNSQMFFKMILVRSKDKSMNHTLSMETQIWVICVTPLLSEMKLTKIEPIQTIMEWIELHKWLGIIKEHLWQNVPDKRNTVQYLQVIVLTLACQIMEKIHRDGIRHGTNISRNLEAWQVPT